MIEEKPIETEAEEELLKIGMAQDISPELDKQIGEAINKLFEIKYSNTTGELNQLERRCLTTLYMKSILYNNKAYRRFCYDYIQKSVLTDRKREKAIVEVLKEPFKYKRPSRLEGVKNFLGLNKP